MARRDLTGALLVGGASNRFGSPKALARLGEETLAERGIAVQLLREPGGVRAAERIRELVTDPELQIGARAEALLYAAARAQLVEEALRPLLHNGTWVLLDRFVDSSLAYQGGGRRLGIDAIRDINEFAIQGLRPDRTLLLVIDPGAGRARSQARGGPADRLENEQRDFFDRTADAYRMLSDRDPERIRTIDAAQPPADVLQSAIDAISDLI